MHPPDDLDEYLRGGSALSRQYRRESAPAPPHALDRRVLRLSSQAQGRPPWLAPLAFAASVLLSVALVLAIAFGPPNLKRDDDTPRLVRVAARADASPNSALSRTPQIYSSDPLRARTRSAWLADIAALRRSGRNREADAELLRFRRAYPDYSSGDTPSRPKGRPG
jgi:negative regulator of sigma E activity